VSGGVLVQLLCCTSATVLTKRYGADVELTQTEGFRPARLPNRLSLNRIERRFAKRDEPLSKRPQKCRIYKYLLNLRVKGTAQA
jgi:hypothetical protein